MTEKTKYNYQDIINRLNRLIDRMAIRSMFSAEEKQDLKVLLAAVEIIEKAGKEEGGHK